MTASRISSQFDVENALLDSCRATVRDMMVKYEWKLVSEGELVGRVLANAPRTAARSKLRTLALQEYTLILYKACRQSNDQSQREQAFAELHRFIYRTAVSKWPDMAEDLAQQALLLVHEQIESCRKPGAFLKFALFKLRQAETQLTRVLEKTRVEEQGEHHQQGYASGQQPSPHFQATQREQLQVLLQAISQIPDTRKQEVIILKYFMELSDEEIATRLAVTANHVRVLRNRGIGRLKKDANLTRYFTGYDR